jgi:hypothetical protein
MVLIFSKCSVKFDAERTKLIQEYEAEKVSYKENLLYRYSSNLTKLKVFHRFDVFY